MGVEYRLELKGLTKNFPGVRALDQVSLKLRPGSVHALMGENGAGKSTLLKCLFGIYHKDTGEIRLEGQKVEIRSPKEALSFGVAMIHQEPNPVPARSVAENFFLGRWPLKYWQALQWVDQEKIESETQKWLERFELKISPRALMRDLSVSELQFVEIAKAVSWQARVIVMDEPTSSLTSREVEKLFYILKDLRSQGVSIIYISHKMTEILEIADEVTVMRDGRTVGHWPATELTTDFIVNKMVGRAVSGRFSHSHKPTEEIVLSLKALSTPGPRGLKQVDLEVRKGEILGIGGLVGSGRTEIFEALFGLRPIKSGEIFFKAKSLRDLSPKSAIKAGMALLTEDRRASGIIPLRSLVDNTTIAGVKRYRNMMGLVSEWPRFKDTVRYIKDLRVKTASPKTAIRDLSGGNQQKILLARWLLTSPDLLLLDEPTRGIDIGAKEEIYQLMDGLALEGKTIIFISSEMSELLGLADRIAVMCEGQLSGVVDAHTATEDDILKLATRFKQKD